MITYTVCGNTSFTSHSATDDLGRKNFDEVQTGIGFITRQFTYHKGKFTDEHKNNEKLKSGPVTNLVKRIEMSDGRILSYEYDKEERIRKISESDKSAPDTVVSETVYTYDSLGQLIKETRDGVVINEMAYDKYGNIKTRNGIAYTYGNSIWKDQLTGYGDRTISYDAQGNPVNYFGHTLTWEKGRQLKKYDSNTYTYNANGIRTGKTVSGVKHSYRLEGTKILSEKWGNNTLTPLYDNKDEVCGIVFNGASYYFLKNLQGDVISILDSGRNRVAEYLYDAWGVCTVVNDETEEVIATVNPFRYRCYYYDSDTGMYYLQSRYYDPVIGRFINADDVSILGTSETVSGYNLFAYCENDSINKIDLFTKEEIDDIVNQYKDVVDSIILTSAIESNLSSLKDVLKGKVSVFAGQSAVGKSSLINCIDYNINQSTNILSRKVERGKHTTRECTIFVLKNNIMIADTPGFSMLELNIKYNELKDYYPEFSGYNCKFYNCTHTSENGCGVKENVNLKKINNDRYNRYLELFKQLKDKWEREYD